MGSQGLVTEVLESEHDSKVAGHFGQDKMIELICRNFWWPKLDAIAKSSLAQAASKTKAGATASMACYPRSSCHTPHGNPLPWISSRACPNKGAVQNFGWLSTSSQKWHISYRYLQTAKPRKISPEPSPGRNGGSMACREKSSRIGTPAPPDSWKVLIAPLGLRPRMSTAFHPLAGGQTWRMGQAIEACLRSFVNNEQSD